MRWRRELLQAPPLHRDPAADTDRQSPDLCDPAGAGGMEAMSLDACRRALADAAFSEEPEAVAIQRIREEFGDVIRPEAMLTGFRWARGEYEKKQQAEAARRAEQAKRFAAAQADDVGCLELLMERLPGIIERLKAEPRS